MYDLLTTEEFSFRAEVDEYNQLLLHMDVFKSTPRVFRKIRQVFKDTKEALHYEGFKLMYTITPSKRFVDLLTTGGVHRGEFEGREVIVWQLD